MFISGALIVLLFLVQEMNIGISCVLTDREQIIVNNPIMDNDSESSY